MSLASFLIAGLLVVQSVGFTVAQKVQVQQLLSGGSLGNRSQVFPTQISGILGTSGAVVNRTESTTQYRWVDSEGRVIEVRFNKDGKPVHQNYKGF